jgi:hypothetical protein
MLEYSGIILANRTTLDDTFFQFHRMSQKTQVSDCTGSTVLTIYSLLSQNFTEG